LLGDLELHRPLRLLLHDSKIPRSRAGLQADRMAQIPLSFGGGFCPVNLSLFHGHAASCW